MESREMDNTSYGSHYTFLNAQKMGKVTGFYSVVIFNCVRSVGDEGWGLVAVEVWDKRHGYE